MDKGKTTTKKDNTALYIVYAAAAYFGLQFIFKPKRAGATTANSYPLPDNNTAVIPTEVVPQETAYEQVAITWVVESFPLRKGMKGSKVKALQKKLGISADGAFGENTEAALLQQYGVSTVSQAQYQSIIGSSASNSPTTITSTVNKWIAETFPLRKGMKGARIKALQQKLGVAADGAFGNNTEAALLKQYGISTLSQTQYSSIVSGSSATATKAAAASSGSTVSKWIAETFPLRKGMKGAKVKALQQKLGLAADGAFGNNTEAALLKKYGISTLSQTQYSSIVSGSGVATTKATTSSGSTISKWVAESFPLRKGMKGTKVKALQQKLGVSADGAFGNNTEAALLKKYGIRTVSQTQYHSIVQPTAATVNKIISSILPWSAEKNSSVVLKSGSRGTEVYRLQKWLGFKDKKAAKKGELIADSIFGNQTLNALKKKTGKTTISVTELNTLTKQVAGFAGEILVTKRRATILDTNLLPHRSVPPNTILGTRLMEMQDPKEHRAYTQFETIDGFRRWIDANAV